MGFIFRDQTDRRLETDDGTIPIPEGRFGSNLELCSYAKTNPASCRYGNLSRFPFGSRKLDSIGKGVGMVQLAEG
jgi:hypothetical protein